MIPLSVVGRDFKVSEAMQAAVEKHVTNLETLYDRIERCEVAISSPHRHHRKGRIYHIGVRLQVPGDDVIVSREPEQNTAHEDFYVALRDTFRAVDRRLQDHVRLMRGYEKHHVPALRGRVKRLFPVDGFGFIETVDGREIYFHKNSVVEARFEDLNEGAEVRFSEEPGEKGPQVTTMHVVGKGGHAPI